MQRGILFLLVMWVTQPLVLHDLTSDPSGCINNWTQKVPLCECVWATWKALPLLWLFTWYCVAIHKPLEYSSNALGILYTLHQQGINSYFCSSHSLMKEYKLFPVYYNTNLRQILHVLMIQVSLNFFFYAVRLLFHPISLVFIISGQLVEHA